MNSHLFYTKYIIFPDDVAMFKLNNINCRAKNAKRTKVFMNNKTKKYLYTQKYVNKLQFYTSTSIVCQNNIRVLQSS